MTELMCVREVKLLLEPMFEAMLSSTELGTLVWRIERVSDYSNEVELPDDALIAPNEAWVRWEVLGEAGGSGSLRLDGGSNALISFVHSDLQDFIAESRFGWGELRGQHGQ
ncbi:hypothetical protein [Pseudarthrobacter sp. PS3-L1]|uniref:hypothetical protein n=1 Tax=Pseudarthrobacter sp. PS3-L1 TaxID=3046207 RepID=UPI0024B88A7F|nr:hypothetical protein [Pseudarthrobacter sp. PS3-L1]MDJ0322011.1 hypothetical protein [Pseudarthrobacter sp. PS3-L1]